MGTDTKQIKKEKEQKLIEMVSAFCDEKLNEEYKELSVAMIQKLGRKRVVPFLTGKPEIWAAAVVYTVGMLNFLFDKSFEPYIPSNAIHDYFGTKSSTITAKSKQIRDDLKLQRFSNDFATGRMIEKNPFNQFVMVDNLTVPISSLPEDLQQMVKEARRNGENISFWSREEPQE